MNILHISDFHYCEDNLIYENVVSAIINAIKEEGISLDCVLFTGDLVYYGNIAGDYAEAKKALFDRFIKELGINKENIIFCEGNHDIDRDQIYPTAENSFSTIYDSNEAINKLYKEKDKAYEDSLRPSSNYHAFERDYYEQSPDNEQTPLYSIHFRTFNGESYGFVCMNSAWLSALDKKGKKDRGNLLYPTEALKEAIIKVKRTKCRRVLLVHHPLHFFKEYNATEIENLVFNNFALMFSGHVHKVSSGSGHDGVNGLYAHVAKASLSHDESSQGCSIISLKDYEDNEVVVKELTYVPDSGECHISSPIIHTIPSGEDKVKAIKFRNTIADKYHLELDNAHKLLLLDDDGVSSEFLSLFTFPQLRTRSDDALGGQEQSDVLTEEDLISSQDNYLFLGRDKCGKTTLLRWAQITYLKGYSRYQVVPFYVNCKEFENRVVDARFSFEDEIRSYYNVNKSKAQELIDSGSFVLLLDNYSDSSAVAAYFKDFLDKNCKCRFIVCAEYSPSKPLESYRISERPLKGFYFQDLNRVEIVRYVEKRIARPEEREEVKEHIVRLCKQMQLPINYWTVSLLLLIHRRSSDTYSQNIFEILDVCVDEIFEKKERALNGADIPFDKLKKICAYVAKRLFLGFESSTYSANRSSIESILKDFIADDDRLDVRPADLFNFFNQCGILKLKSPGAEEFVFRHNGFFEYFLALQMTEDDDFRDYVLCDSNLYLAFKNEWDIYSGIRRNDGLFLQSILEITSVRVGRVLAIPNEHFDKVLVEKGKVFASLEDKYREIMTDKPLSAISKAAIEDEVDALALDADVKPLGDFISEGFTPDMVERYLFILGRVYRNMDNIPNQMKQLKQEAFDKLLFYYANFAFFSIDFVSQRAEAVIKESGVDFTESQEKAILKLITDFSPLLAQVALTDSIGHKSMSTLLKKKLSEVENTVERNQYFVFILTLVLADIDLNDNMPLVRGLMSELSIPILKSMLYFKLNYYMAFRAGGNRKLQDMLSSMIREQRHNMDNSIKDKNQQKAIAETRKRSDTLSQKGKF